MKGNIQSRRLEGIKSEINEAKESFFKSLSNLELSDEANQNLERSVLDCAIHISLNFLELVLIERIIDGKDIFISSGEADDIGNGNWEKFVQSKTILKYLSQIGELEKLQKEFESRDELKTQEFANQARRGLRVTPWEFCRQFESYCKGLCLHQSGYINEALVYYSQSLTQGGHYSQNKMRLNALEAIELIIGEKQELEIH